MKPGDNPCPDRPSDGIPLLTKWGVWRGESKATPSALDPVRGAKCEPQTTRNPRGGLCILWLLQRQRAAAQASSGSGGGKGGGGGIGPPLGGEVPLGGDPP